jgi:hypothetical protein
MRTYFNPCDGYEEALKIYSFMRDAFPAAVIRVLTPCAAGMWGVSVTM